MSPSAPRPQSPSNLSGLWRGRLPDPVSSFVGRADEIADVTAAAAVRGVVTLVGPPGVGKTRLALEVGRASSRSSRPVFWVDLTPLRRPEAVAEALAGALGVLEEPKLDMTSQVVNALCNLTALVVLDNCEHLTGACAELVGALVRSCPEITVLATSRQPLEVESERRSPVAPMSRADGTELFYARAAANDVGFDVSDESAAAVADICAHLDGIPLAIELAAGRVGVLSPVEIAARLAEDPLGLLAGGALDSEGRHKCVRVALDWSYGLLSIPEKALLRRLSVFSGGATAGAAQEVCAGGRLVARRVPELLGALVAKSLVVVRSDRVGDGSGSSNDESAGEARYVLLETVRLYANEKMASRGEAAKISARHAALYKELAQQAGPGLTGPNQLEALAAVDAEHDNLAAAFAWALDQPTDDALRLAAPLAVWWRVRGRFTEGRRWLEEALEHCPDAAPALRAKALWGGGFLAHMVGDNDAGTAQLSDALAISREEGDLSLEARALLLLGNVDMDAAEERALTKFKRSARLAKNVDDHWCLAHSLALAGSQYERRLRFVEARRSFRTAVAVARRANDLQGLRIGLHLTAESEMGEGNESTAESHCVEALQVCNALGDAYGVAAALHLLGQVAYQRRDWDCASDALEKSLTQVSPAGPLVDVIGVRCGLGFVALRQQRLIDARRNFEESLALGTSENDGRFTSQALQGLAVVDIAKGDHRNARFLLDQALVAAMDEDDRTAVADALSALADLTAAEGDTERALGLCRRAIVVWLEVGKTRGLAHQLEFFAALVTKVGGERVATRLLASSTTMRDSHGCVRSPEEQVFVDQTLDELGRRLSVDEFEAAWTEGASMPIGDLVGGALKHHRLKKEGSDGWPSLTESEREVARLLIEGRTNRQIAEHLMISTRTAEGYVANIFTKLAVSSRSELLQRSHGPRPDQPDRRDR